MTLSPSYTLGLIFIVLVSLIWAAASVLVQWVYSDEFEFDSPFLLTYIGVSLFTSFLPAHWIYESLIEWRRNKGQQQGGQGITLSSSLGNVAGEYERVRSTSMDVEDSTTETTLPSPSSSRPIWTIQDHFSAAAKIAPLWFVSNYAYNASLEYTSITSSTVLASTGSLFTFLFALMTKDEQFSIWKLLGILLGMTGSILTGLHDFKQGGGDNSTTTNNDTTVDGNNGFGDVLWGDLLGLISAVGYGGYTTMVRILCPPEEESVMSMQLFLGFVGLWNMVILSPIAIYLSVFQTTGLTGFIFGCLILKGLFDNVLSDYLWARAVILTSATVATVGLGLTIPLAFATDVVMGRPNVLDGASIFGAIAVLVGFVLVNLGQQEEQEQQQQQMQQQQQQQHENENESVAMSPMGPYADEIETDPAAIR